MCAQHGRTLGGASPPVIADTVKLPKSLSSFLGARGYYGDLRHNVKAVYQFYMGAYDGNPVNLDPLPPQESAKHYLELIGSDKAVAAAQTAFDKGEYRWAAQLLNDVVFGQPDKIGAAGAYLRSDGLYVGGRDLA
jgi:alkyl sulfatase BDS1-like metallo-beta-lactamase superfamily hydrolase